MDHLFCLDSQKEKYDRVKYNCWLANEALWIEYCMMYHTCTLYRILLMTRVTLLSLTMLFNSIFFENIEIFSVLQVPTPIDRSPNVLTGQAFSAAATKVAKIKDIGKDETLRNIHSAIEFPVQVQIQSNLRANGKFSGRICLFYFQFVLIIRNKYDATVAQLWISLIKHSKCKYLMISY